MSDSLSRTPDQLRRRALLDEKSRRARMPATSELGRDPRDIQAIGIGAQAKGASTGPVLVTGGKGLATTEDGADLGAVLTRGVDHRHFVASDAAAIGQGLGQIPQ